MVRKWQSAGLAGVVVGLALFGCSEPATVDGGISLPDTVKPGDGNFLTDVLIPDQSGDDSAAVDDMTDGEEVLDVADEEIVVEPGSYGAPCGTNDDCNSGFCVQDAGGKVCSRVCSGECDKGWLCTQVASGADTAYICLPSFARLCDPCATSTDCNPPGGGPNLCVSRGDLGSFCGVACDPEVADFCPTGFECKTPDGGSGTSAAQCVRVSGDCPCSATAVAGQLQTACSHTTSDGSCTGTRGCAGGKLSACTATEPALETCNTLDDDCDGQTDEIEVPEPCYQENEFGKCTGTIQECKGGQPVCSAAVPTAEVCNGLDDNCKDGVDEGLCADAGDACNSGACDITTGKCVPVPKLGGCDDKNACTDNDTCQNGACAGTPKDCSAFSSACQTAVCEDGACVAGPKDGACDDGNPCTINDTCAGGTCKGELLDCSAWTDSCNTGVCQAGQCVPQPKAGGACDDGNACTVSDSCQAGSCIGQLKDCGMAADICNDGVCGEGGVCVQKPKSNATVCNDSDSCTSADHCQAGQCTGTMKDCSNFTDLCNTGMCEFGSCTKKVKPSGTVCSDGDACTLNDACAGGVCKGTAKDCSGAGDQCNVGACSGGSCVKVPSNNGGSCTDSSTCTVADKCSNGQCIGTSTADKYELNDSSGSATALADRSDCDPAMSLTATHSPSGEVDWYTFMAKDDWGCTIKPSVQLSLMASDYDVCLYFRCEGGSVAEGTVSCTNGTKTSGGPGGSWGCCSTLSGTTNEFAKVSPSCSLGGLGSESGTLWAKVYRKSAASVCGGYSLTWSAKN
ncbi:MAG: hypothetical protein ACOYOB_06835 [Myxococcota bacterium]